jgi:predicted Zn-dependent protease
MEAGPSSRSSIHGLPAASATFRFTGEGAEVRGRVAFVRHAETLFQLVGYATPDAWRERSAGLQEAIESFRSLEDPAVLQVQPARLRVTEVPRSMALEAFLREEGALDVAEDVRQLNRLEGNPTLERGRMMKIPVGGPSAPGI